MAIPPKTRREAIALYNELCDDHHRGVAAKMAGEKFDLHPNTILKFTRKSVKVEPLTSEDFEIKPVAVAVSKMTRIEPGERLLEMVVSDIHWPFEDRAAYQLMLGVAQDIQPDILVLLGDILDCYAVSAHDKDANRATPAAFKEELGYARRKLQEIRELLPDTRIIYKEGNHETRLSRYITKNAAALSNLGCVTLPELLGLSELKIEWIANDDRLRIGKVFHIHGNEVSGAGMSPARLKYQRMQCNFIFGHHHIRDKFRPRSYDGQQHGAYANPCLCDLEPEYMHHTHSWSLGFTVIDHDTDGTFQVEEIEVIKPETRSRQAKCNVRGRIYKVDLDD